MTELQWMIVVVACFVLATVAFWWRARRDMFGAISASLLVLLLAALCITVSGCAVSPEYRPWMEAGIAYDREHTVGNDPACIVRIRQPIGPSGKERWLVVGVEHHSSCPDQTDRGEVNQIEVMAVIPLGREK